jgi:hypothetical protein
LLRDHDGIYVEYFQNRVEGMGIEEVITTPQSPFQNPFAERVSAVSGENLRRVLLDQSRVALLCLQEGPAFRHSDLNIWFLSTINNLLDDNQ